MPRKATWQSLLLPACCGASARRRQARTGKSSLRRLSFSDVSSPEDLSLSLMGCDLIPFTLAELDVATSGFSDANFLGEGGFGPVYKGFVDDKVCPGLEARPVAVKLLDLDGAQGHKEWLVWAFLQLMGLILITIIFMIMHRNCIVLLLHMILFFSLECCRK